MTGKDQNLQMEYFSDEVAFRSDSTFNARFIASEPCRMLLSKLLV